MHVNGNENKRCIFRIRCSFDGLLFFDSIPICVCVVPQRPWVVTHMNDSITRLPPGWKSPDRSKRDLRCAHSFPSTLPPLPPSNADIPVCLLLCEEMSPGAETKEEEEEEDTQREVAALSWSTDT